MSHLIESRATTDNAMLATVAVPNVPGSQLRARLVLASAFGAVVLASLITIPGLNSETSARLTSVVLALLPATAFSAGFLIEKRIPGLLLDLIVFGSLPLLAYVLLQSLGLDWNEWDAIPGRGHAGLGNANHTAVLTLVTLASSLRPARSMSSFRHSIGALAVCVIVATGSRTGLIIAVWLIVGQVIMPLAKHWSSGARAMIQVAATIAGSLILFLALTPFSGRYLPAQLFTDGSFTQRVGTAKQAISSFGWIDFVIGDGRYQATDNLILDVMKGSGALSVIPIAFLVGGVVFSHMRGRRKTRYAPLVVLFLLASLPHGLPAAGVAALWLMVGAGASETTEGASSPAPMMPRIAPAMILWTTVAGMVSVFRPADSPGFLPYPAPSPLPVWLSWRFEPVSLSILFAAIATSVFLIHFAMRSSVSDRHATA